MVKIGVISDTHFLEPKKARLPKKVLDVFKHVDAIFHAGDVIYPEILEQLSKLAKVYAVRGNMDIGRPTASLPEKLIETVEGVKIGIIHGWGPPHGIKDRIRAKMPSDVRCIVFGHTHSPEIEEKDGILFFNPGSATDKIYTLYNSVGILTIESGQIKGEIIQI